MAVAPAQPQPLDEGAQQPAQPQPLEGSRAYRAYRPYSAPAAHLEPRYSQLMTMSRCTHVSAYFCTCGRASQSARERLRQCLTEPSREHAKPLEVWVQVWRWS